MSEKKPLNFQQLIDTYTDLLQKTFPRPPEKRKTFLEIGNVPHFELVISNFYAFYLRKDEEHGFIKEN